MLYAIARVRLLTLPLLVLATLGAQDLSGIWRCNDGGVYRVTQIGPHVWWYGRSADGGKSWQNVFHGAVIAAGELTGNWADLPPGATRNNGFLNIRVQGGRLVATSQTGGFAGSVWTRGADLPEGQAVSSADVTKGIESLTPKPDTRETSSYTARLPDPYATDFAPMLERIIRRLAGTDGWNRYFALEVDQLHATSAADQVAYRSEFINLLLGGG